MTCLPRITFALVACSALACGVAVAGNAGEEPEEQVEMSGGGERMLGKRAFDAAAAGYAPFEPLAAESPRRTLARANEQLAVLELDLVIMQKHFDPARRDAELHDELTHAAALITEARLNVAAADARAGGINEARLDEVVSLIGEAQLVLHGVRQQRVQAS